MVLTVLSAFARRNVDPWEEAADLSRLSGDTAMRKMISLLEGLPGQSSLADRTATAGRLLPLLPHPVEASVGRGSAVRETIPANPRRSIADLSLILLYLALMLVGQWVFSGSATKMSEEHPAAATTTSAAKTPPAVGPETP